jgi:PLP dependent protein
VSRASIQQSISHYEETYSRPAGSVQLLAVSKGQAFGSILDMYQQGQRDFAENQLQEALTKIKQSQDLGLIWHFIGHVQSNKTTAIATNFDWVHSIDSVKIAQRLARARPSSLAPLQVCIQINIDAEPTKSGIALSALPALAAEICGLPQLTLRGLMTVPKPRHSYAEQLIPLQKTAEALASLNANGYNLDTLSMGMSADYRAAIAAGATMVRLGRVLFGERQ